MSILAGSLVCGLVSLFLYLHFRFLTTWVSDARDCLSITNCNYKTVSFSCSSFVFYFVLHWNRQKFILMYEMNNSEHQQRSVFTLLFVEFSFWKLDLCVQFLLEVARQKNQTPLPLIKPYTGPRLPPDRYCLTAPNYRLKSVQKKVKTLKLLLYLR